MMKSKQNQYSSDSEDSMPLNRTSRKGKSTDSEDDVPIGSLKSHNINSYSKLCEQGLERCEFCDQVFNTRLASIKHNASHIIIPLLKLTLHQCDHCLFYFTSLEKLRTHTTSKNHKTSQFSETSHLKPDIEYQKILQSIVEKRVVVKCHDALSEVLNPKKSNIAIPARSPKELNDKKVVVRCLDTLSKVNPIKKSNILVPAPKPELISGIKEEVYEISSESDNESFKKDYNTDIKSNHVRENSNLERENGNRERENGNRERENDNLKRKNGNIDDGSSSFPFSYLEMSSPSQMRDGSSPIEPLSHRIMFEDDDDDDLFEAEEILPDKPNRKYFPVKKNSYIIGGNTCTDTSQNFDISSGNTDTSQNFDISSGNTDTSQNFDISKTLQNAIVDVFNNSNKNTIPNVNSFIFGSQTVKTPNKLLSQTFTSDKLASQTCNINGVEEKEVFTESVHFDELIEPQICDCRYCGRCFSNRLELIKHESTHMRARPPRVIVCCVCERYLSGNHWTLRKHMQKYHPDNEIKRKIKRCTICYLPYYNYMKHAAKYHKATCNTCSRPFDRYNRKTHECSILSASNKLVQLDPASDTRVIKLCEICLAFAKNRHNVHYKVLREHSEVGHRQHCHGCHNVCFEVSLVQRKVRQRENTGTCRRRPMSNEERLKKMQSRLKLVNKLNKC